MCQSEHFAIRPQRKNIQFFFMTNKICLQFCWCSSHDTVVENGLWGCWSLLAQYYWVGKIYFQICPALLGNCPSWKLPSGKLLTPHPLYCSLIPSDGMMGAVAQRVVHWVVAARSQVENMLSSAFRLKNLQCWQALLKKLYIETLKTFKT